MVGGITVAGLVTGTHVIEDIKIAVPHQIAVFIPADLAYRSKDLWRGISQRQLFQLTGGSGLAVESNSRVLPPPSTDLEDTRAENKKLRQQLEEAQRQNLSLQEALQAMQGQLTSILRLLGRIENGEVPLLRGVSGPGLELLPSVPAQPRVVGGEVPSFIPDDIHPDDVKTSIDAEVTVGSSVADQVKALRAARRRG
jgi:hypothetical protein